MCIAGLSVCICFCTWAGKSRCAFVTKTGVDESGISLCKDLNGSIPLQSLYNNRQTCVFLSVMLFSRFDIPSSLHHHTGPRFSPCLTRTFHPSRKRSSAALLPLVSLALSPAQALISTFISHVLPLKSWPISGSRWHWRCFANTPLPFIFSNLLLRWLMLSCYNIFSGLADFSYGAQRYPGISGHFVMP